MRWRGVPVLHYIDQRVDSSEREISFRWQAMQQEIDRRVHSVEESARATAAEMNNRLGGMNEIRGSLTDVLARAVTRDMYDAGHEALSQRLIALINANAGRIDRIESALDRQKGRQAAYAALAAIAGVLVTLFILAAAHISVH